MIMFNDFLEMHDDVTLAQGFMERAQILLHEITYDFLALVERKKPYYYQDAHTAFVKAEMADETLDRLKEALDRLYEETKPSSEEEAESPRDHQGAACADPAEEVRAQIMDEYSQSIADFVSVIEGKPDLIRRMMELKKAAMLLAAGQDIHIVADHQD